MAVGAAYAADLVVERLSCEVQSMQPGWTVQCSTI